MVTTALGPGPARAAWLVWSGPAAVPKALVSQIGESSPSQACPLTLLAATQGSQKQGSTWPLSILISLWLGPCLCGQLVLSSEARQV